MDCEIFLYRKLQRENVLLQNTASCKRIIIGIQTKTKTKAHTGSKKENHNIE